MENQEIKKAYDKLFDCYQKLPTQDGDQAIDMLIRSGVRFIDTIIRNAPFYYGKNSFAICNEVAAEECRITFSEIEHGIKLDIPHNIPKLQKENGNSWQRTDYYRLMVIQGINKALSGKTYSFSNPLIEIESEYISKSHILDYDNQDYKPVLDAISLLFLKDDSPLCYRLLLSGKIGEKSATHIYIRDK